MNTKLLVGGTVNCYVVNIDRADLCGTPNGIGLGMVRK